MPELKNEKYERFAREYIIDLNATQAATRAGYSPKTAYSIGQRLLKKVEISTRVHELEKDITDALGLTAAGVVSKWMSVADRAMTAVPVITYDQASGEMRESGEYRFDSQGANRALENLAKYLGIADGKSVSVELDGKKIKVTLTDD